MSRLTEDEREALKQAALAAAPVLERFKKERDDLNARIARLENIVAASNDAVGKRPRRAAGLSIAVADAVPPAEAVKIKRGQAGEHIDAVLRGGGDYSEPEMRKEIADRFHTTYSRATLYTTLRRGLGKKYELKDKKRWRIKTSAE